MRLFLPKLFCIIAALLIAASASAQQVKLTSPRVKARLRDEWDRYRELVPQARCDVRTDQWTNGQPSPSYIAYSYDHVGDSLLFINHHFLDDDEDDEVSGLNRDYEFYLTRRKASAPWELLLHQRNERKPKREVYSEINPITVGMSLLRRNLVEALDGRLIVITDIRRKNDSRAVEIDLEPPLQSLPAGSQFQERPVRMSKDNHWLVEYTGYADWRLLEGTARLSTDNHWLIEQASYTGVDSHGYRRTYAIKNTFGRVPALKAKVITSREVVTNIDDDVGKREYREVYWYDYSDVLPDEDDCRLSRFGLDESPPTVPDD